MSTRSRAALVRRALSITRLSKRVLRAHRYLGNSLKSNSRQLSRAPSSVLYVAISASALLLDVVTGWASNQILGIGVPFASVIGYCLGLFFAFPLLRRFAFAPGRLSTATTSILYVLSAFVGVISTWVAASFVVLVLSQDYFFAKAFAAVLSFVLVYLFRRFFVFR